MTASTHPYAPERQVIGATRAGGSLVLMPMTPEAAGALVPQITAIGPWAHYGFATDLMHKALLTKGDGAIRYQLLCDRKIAGAVVIRSPWLAGPYLQMLVVLPAYQGGGAGAAVLEWYESNARQAGLRQVWLCVTGVNTGAQRLYQRHGYTLAGTLLNMIRDGDDELLMRKMLTTPLGGS